MTIELLAKDCLDTHRDLPELQQLLVLFDSLWTCGEHQRDLSQCEQKLQFRPAKAIFCI